MVLMVTIKGNIMNSHTVVAHSITHAHPIIRKKIKLNMLTNERCIHAEILMWTNIVEINMKGN